MKNAIHHTAIVRLVQHTTNLGLVPEDLDETVHDLADELAADTNNAGPDGQIEFMLNAGMDEASIKKTLDDIAAEKRA